MKQHARDRTDDTCDALLRAGRDLFARHGYDGASVRALTSAARTNLGAITYHYGSKRALYERVVATVMEPLADRVIAALATPGTPLDRIAAAERAFFQHFAAHAEAPRLMMQELAAGRAFPPSGAIAMRRVHTAMSLVIAQGQADGSMRSGDPALMALSVVSQPAHLHLVRGPLKAATGVDLLDTSTSERVVDNAVAFVRGGLAALPS